MENIKIFVNGLISVEVPQTAPEWILGKNSIKVDELIKWLQENKHLANEAGYINTVTKASKTTGKRYIEVDTWKAQGEVKIEKEVVVPPSNNDTGEAEAGDIPF